MNYSSWSIGPLLYTYAEFSVISGIWYWDSGLILKISDMRLAFWDWFCKSWIWDWYLRYVLKIWDLALESGIYLEGIRTIGVF